jgi:hypothetical protein
VLDGPASGGALADQSLRGVPDSDPLHTDVNCRASLRAWHQGMPVRRSFLVFLLRVLTEAWSLRLSHRRLNHRPAMADRRAESAATKIPGRHTPPVGFRLTFSCRAHGPPFATAKSMRTNEKPQAKGLRSRPEQFAASLRIDSCPVSRSAPHQHAGLYDLIAHGRSR